MLRGIWHMSFTVRDLERSVALYRDVLGLELIHSQRQANPCTRTLVGYPDADLKVAMLRIAGTDPKASGHVLELVPGLRSSFYNRLPNGAQ